MAKKQLVFSTADDPGNFSRLAPRGPDIGGVFWATNLTVSFALASSLLREAAADEAEESSVRSGLYAQAGGVSFGSVCRFGMGT